jgi:hypothetical protein
LNSEKVIPETVVIFADEYLLRLPLESLSALKNSPVQCLARDLSLQMHYHRFHSTEVSGIGLILNNDCLRLVLHVKERDLVETNP